MRSIPVPRTISSLVLVVPLLTLATLAVAEESKYENFDPSRFSDASTRVDNPWLPLRPGTRYVYEGSALDDEGDRVATRVEIHVTDLVKVIDGVKSVVTWDLDYADGDLVESEIAFFAQDDDGNVWRMGEYPEEYDDGELEDAPAWIAGVGDAKAGIAMPARPEVGAPSFSQGWAPSVEFTDRARIDQLGARVETGVGAFDDVVVVAEWSEEDAPGAVQLKYHARGLGNIKVGFRGPGDEEQLDLVAVEALSPLELTSVRAAALALEGQAFQRNEGYATTQPAAATEVRLARQLQPVHTPKASPLPNERKISDAAAKKIALDTVAGQVTDIGIERKLGQRALVVEVIAAEDNSEIDVIIDMETGEVLGTER